MRFPGFERSWKENQFKNLTKINQGLQIPIAERLTEKEEGAYFYITNEFLKENSEKKYYIKSPPKSVLCERNDILMTRTGNTGKVVTNVSGAFHNNFFKIAYPKTLDKDFLFYSLVLTTTQNIIKRLAGTSTIPDLNHSDFYRISIKFPQIKEQKKISTFLSSIEGRIQTQSKIIEDYKLFKKGVVQKLFKQEIRFKDEEGKNYPEWKKKKLQEILNYEQPAKYLVADTEYDDDYKTPVLTAGKTFLLGYTNEENGIFKDNLPTIIFDDFTTAFQYVDFPFKAKSSAMKMLIPQEDNINLKFIFEAMKTIKFPLAEHKRYWISEYQNEKIPYPCIKEQQKIAETLSAIDRKIELETKLLTQLNQQKQYFLQNLFI